MVIPFGCVPVASVKGPVFWAMQEVIAQEATTALGNFYI
jgi:hypothetical protein